jgi:hypothetical protein
VADVPAEVVRRHAEAIEVQLVEQVAHLGHGALHIGQRRGAEDGEPRTVVGDQCGTEVVDRSSGGAAVGDIAERTRRRHERQHRRGEPPRSVERELVFDGPLAQRHRRPDSRPPTLAVSVRRPGRSHMCLWTSIRTPAACPSPSTPRPLAGMTGIIAAAPRAAAVPPSTRRRVSWFVVTCPS